LKKRFRFILSLALVAITSGAQGFPAHATDASSVGSVGIRIAQIPAAVAEEPFSDVYIISRLQPSTTLTQRLEVFNTSTQEFKVNVYPGAATFVDGKFVVVDGKIGNTLTIRTKLSPNVLSVKPGESKTFMMTITAPGDAVSEQEFGVIWAEVQGAPNSSGVTTVSRVGIRMYIPVGNSPAISISKASLTSNTNQIVVKKTSSTRYLFQIIYILSALNIFFFLLLLFCYRRNSSDRKERKRSDKRDEAEWRKEKERRGKISKQTGI
jgi:hypothetical protein